MGSECYVARRDPNGFAIVRVAAIARVKNDVHGHQVLELRNSNRTVAVGRSYTHRFRQM